MTQEVRADQAGESDEHTDALGIIVQESLQSFCRWCIDRGYLPSDPLARLRKFDMTPRITRRP